MSRGVLRATTLCAWLLGGCDEQVLVGRLPSSLQDGGAETPDAVVGTPGWQLRLAQQVASQGAPAALAGGDLNRDGQLDVLAAQPEATETLVLLGAAGQLSALPGAAGGGAAAMLALADFGGTSALDVVQASRDRAELQVLAGQGDGRFAAPLTQVLPAAAVALAAGDFDGDGASDVVAALTDKELAVLLRRDGDLTTTAVVARRYPLSSVPQALVVADFDGDGRADVAVAGREAQLWFFAGRADGLQTGATDSTLQPGLALAAADLSGDGRPELAVARASNDVIVFSNLGNGRLFWDQKVGPHYPTGAEPRALALADFDRDGVIDLLSAHAGASDLGLRRGLGVGGFAPALLLLPCDRAPAALLVADLNRDGAPDAVVAGAAAHAVSVFLNAAR